MIVKATPEDHLVLTKITKASKAFWGYSREQMELWDSDLTISPEYIKKNIVYKFLVGENTVAYYSLEIISSEKIHLENLFVLPEFIGKGFGKLLLTDALHHAKMLGCREMTLDSDPNATSFYLRNGFEITGQKETSIENRFMPVMKKYLK